jgi:hypothetical protein
MGLHITETFIDGTKVDQFITTDDADEVGEDQFDEMNVPQEWRTWIQRPSLRENVMDLVRGSNPDIIETPDISVATYVGELKGQPIYHDGATLWTVDKEGIIKEAE